MGDRLGTAGAVGFFFFFFFYLFGLHNHCTMLKVKQCCLPSTWMGDRLGTAGAVGFLFFFFIFLVFTTTVLC